jgi:polyphosphate kinase
VRHDVVIHEYDKLSSRDKAYLEDYFSQAVFPLLTPLAIDSGHPFPQVLNRSLNLLFLINNDDDPDERRAAVLQLPQVLSRFVQLPRKTGFHYVLMEEVIQAYSGFFRACTSLKPTRSASHAMQILKLPKTKRATF